MGWCTTSDLDRFTAAAGGYLRSRAAENALLLSAEYSARMGWRARVAGPPRGPGPSAGAGMFFGWWEPPDGSAPRAAFLHDPAVPLLIAGRAPEMAAALAGTLAKMGRQVCGVDGPVEVADAFAAAWSQRSHAPVRVHRHCRVYRLDAATMRPGAGVEATLNTEASPGAGDGDRADGAPGSWQPAGPAGRLRVATAADRELLIDWITAFAGEAGERIGSPPDAADDLISYGGTVFWEVPQRARRLREAAQYLVSSHHREAAQRAEPVLAPVAMAALTRPVARMVRISMVYTPPEGRRNGYAAAVTLAASQAALGGFAPGAASAPAGEVVLITDRNRPDRRVARLGYQLVGERAVFRFGPPTGPLPRLRATGPMPRLPTGPMPRWRR